MRLRYYIAFGAAGLGVLYWYWSRDPRMGERQETPWSRLPPSEYAPVLAPRQAPAPAASAASAAPATSAAPAAPSGNIQPALDRVSPRLRFGPQALYEIGTLSEAQERALRDIASTIIGARRGVAIQTYAGGHGTRNLFVATAQGNTLKQYLVGRGVPGRLLTVLPSDYHRDMTRVDLRVYGAAAAVA